MQLLQFPRDRSVGSAQAIAPPVRLAHEQVAVIHHGETEIYDSPAMLVAAVLATVQPTLEVVEGRSVRAELARFKARIRRRARRNTNRALGHLVAGLAGCSAAAILIFGLGL